MRLGKVLTVPARALGTFLVTLGDALAETPDPDPGEPITWPGNYLAGEIEREDEHMNTNPMDEWSQDITAHVPQELAQIVGYGDWHNMPNHNREPLTPAHGSRWAALKDLVCRVGVKLADALVWFGRPFRPFGMVEDGVLFAPNGQTYRDTTATHDEWAALGERIWAECGPPSQPGHRTPRAWNGYYWTEGTDALTGWPYHQLKRCEDA